ncbi:MAG: class I SAM-dependent methyltransferase [Hyphomicrobiales bacterium]|nr:class I SAM-dependent methyltransferase [Hyphomicrobiales bacterium]MCP5370899.1 class I SAM-dependent methyltransferase [Hyphomicrobiales bacterium]
MSDPSFWDEKFADDAYMFGTEPNEFLETQAPLFRPGMAALAVADGEGRNGVWLAGRGLEVTSVDFSSRGLDKARRLAAERGVSLHTVRADLLHWDWPVAAFDAVVSMYIHFAERDRRRVHAAMVAALRPGGVLVLESFNPDQVGRGSGGPPTADLMYTADMLRGDFAALEIDMVEELTFPRPRGRHAGKDVSIVRLVARKP